MKKAIIYLFIVLVLVISTVLSAGAVCDVNDDGVVDQADVDAINRYIYNPDAYNSIPAEKFDIDRNGKVTNLDLKKIYSYIAGAYSCDIYGHTNENGVCGCGYVFNSGCRHSWINDLGFCKSCGERVSSATFSMKFLSITLSVALIVTAVALILGRKKKIKV